MPFLTWTDACSERLGVLTAELDQAGHDAQASQERAEAIERADDARRTGGTYRSRVAGVVSRTGG
jgi:DNA-binding transcriptional regulator YdaS (Cro superfamily)